MKKFEKSFQTKTSNKSPEKKPNRFAQLALGTATFAISQFSSATAMGANSPQPKVNREPTQMEILATKPSMILTDRSQVRAAVWLGQIKVGDVVEIQGKKMLIKGDENGKVGRNTIDELEKITQTFRISNEQELNTLFHQNYLRVGDTIILPNGERKLIVGQKFSNGESKVTQNSLLTLKKNIQAISHTSNTTTQQIPTVNHTQKLANLAQSVANKPLAISPKIPSAQPSKSNISPAIVAPKSEIDLSQYLAKPKTSVRAESQTSKLNKVNVSSTPISDAINKLKTKQELNQPAIQQPEPTNQKPASLKYQIADGRLINEEIYPGLRGPKLLYIEGVTTTEKDYRRVISQCEAFIAPNSTTPIECKMAIGMVLRDLIRKDNWHGVEAILGYHSNDAKDRWEVFPDDWSQAYSKAISNLDYKTSFFKDAENREKFIAHLNTIAEPQESDFSNQLQLQSRKTLMSLAGAISRESMSVIPRSGVGLEFLNGSVGLKAVSAKTDKQMNEVIQKIIELVSINGVQNSQKMQIVVNRVLNKRIEELVIRKNSVNAYYSVFSKMATLSYSPSALIDQEIASLQLVKTSLRNISKFVK